MAASNAPTNCSAMPSEVRKPASAASSPRSRAAAIACREDIPESIERQATVWDPAMQQRETVTWQEPVQVRETEREALHDHVMVS